MRCSNKVALVTGGSRGIGRSIAESLAREGASVAVNYEKNLAAAEEAVASARALGAPKALAVQADVSSSAQVDAMMHRVVDEFGGIDILVNSAGLEWPGHFVDFPEELFDRTMAVNVKGVFLCSRAAARRMIDQGRGGRIVNISSISARMSDALEAAYCASKAAVEQLTKCGALAWAPHKITVNAVAPGFVTTDFTKDFGPAYAALKGQSEADFLSDFLQAIPWHRFGKGSDIAHAVTFLASEEAEYITGVSLSVSGGIDMH